MRLVSFLIPSISSSCWVFIILALMCHSCFTHKNTTDILCIERERVALLEFKHDLIDRANRLVSWGSDEDDCCKWEGIVCDIFKGHVHEIHLRGPPSPTFEIKDFVLIDLLSNPNILLSMFSGKINPSLLHLEQLEYLDMSGNDFQEIQIPKFIGFLRNLRYLNLSDSLFSGEIPPQLGNLSKLHTLGLSSDDSFTSNLQWLSNLPMLQNLDMSGVDLSKATNWLHMINSLPSLAELRLSHCDLPISPLDPLLNVNFSSLFLLDLSYNSHLSGDVLWNMTSLRTLYVSGNPFMNSPTVLKRLSSTGYGLTTLDISGCDLCSSTIAHLQNMTSLVVLDLSSNQLTKAIPESLGNLCNLRQLHLSDNIFGEISLFEVLKTFFDCNSSKLEWLEMSSTNVSGHLPEQLGNLHNLVNLNLQNNSISGSIPHFIGTLSSLRILDLRFNLISGSIPYSLGSLSSLRSLALGYNELSGNLPQSIGHLSELETMDVSSIKLMGMVTEDHFANLTKLKVFLAGDTGLTLKLRSINWVPPFQLSTLDLSSWDLGPQFPKWLQSQTRLLFLDISNTRITDIMPSWFWSRLSNLLKVKISFNQIQGSLSKIPASVGSLEFNANNLSGPLPELSNNSVISYLDLSSNSFSESLNPFLCQIESSLPLFYLNLSYNNLSGVIPQCWENWKSLRVLDFENNNLFGEIPSSLGYLSNLQMLNMCKNKLIGKLPVSLMSLTRLMILQLSQNELIGNIPSWLGRQLKDLKIFQLRSNRFSGDISFDLCHLTSLQVLDLAHNCLSGHLPACFSNFSVMSSTEISIEGRNMLFTLFGISMQLPKMSVTLAGGSIPLKTRGREDRYSSTLGLVNMLDLSNNNFSGPIPNELMSLIALQSMSLSGNHLTGKIPKKIGDLKSVEYLDLSLNELYGEIPSSLADLNSLTLLNLSYNHLTGRIPTSTQLQLLDSSSFTGNRLCGPPLIKDCGVAMPDDDDDDGRGTKQGNNATHEVDWGFVISILLGFVIGFWVVVGPLIVSRSWRISYFRILNKVRYGIYDAICKYFF